MSYDAAHAQKLVSCHFVFFAVLVGAYPLAHSSAYTKLEVDCSKDRGGNGIRNT